jgi:hypothetical protein
LPANEHFGRFRRVRQHRLRQKLAALLSMSTIFSAVIGFMRREAPFDKPYRYETAAARHLIRLL